MTTVAEKEAAENLADILYAEWLGTGANYDAWIAVAFKAIAELGARAEKAEQERDQFRSQAALFQRGVVEAEQARDEARAQIDTHLTLCGGAPMTTVDEDGRVCRMEMATDGADCLYLTREGFATTIPAHSADRALYVLVPIEDAPSEGEGE